MEYFSKNNKQSRFDDVKWDTLIIKKIFSEEQTKDIRLDSRPSVATRIHVV